MIKPLPFHGDGESGNELWAPLPSDILGHIASKLTAADYASACAACKSWRAVFSPHHPGLLPFLLLPPHYTLPDPLRLRSPTPPLPDYPIGTIVPFSRLDHRHSDSPFFPLDSLRNPTFRPHVCVGSSHGWLILLGPTSHISLLNPLTTDTIPLPPPLSSAPLSLTLYDENIVDRYLLFRGDPPRRLCHLAALVRSPSSPPTPPMTPPLSSSSSSSGTTSPPASSPAARAMAMLRGSPTARSASLPTASPTSSSTAAAASPPSHGVTPGAHCTALQTQSPSSISMPIRHSRGFCMFGSAKTMS